MNVAPIGNKIHPDEVFLALSEFEYDVNDPLPDAGEASSVAAIPVTYIVVVDDNSNQLGPTDVSIIRPTAPFLSFHMRLV